MKKTTLYITRHGQTEWNVAKIMQGHHDSPLTELGVSQATWLSEALSHIDFAAIYSSSTLRARRTAEILLRQRSIEVVAHDHLREIYMGEWEGRKASELEERYSEEFAAFWNNPHLFKPVHGGESYYDLQERVVPLLKTIIARHEGEEVLIVTHAGTLKMIMGHFGKRPLADLWKPPIIEPTGLCKVVIEDGSPTIELYGDTSHYRL